MSRRTAAVTFGSMAVGLVVALASTAWACTAFLMLSGPSEAPGLSQVTITGAGLGGSRTVELHWNGAAGPVVGTASTDANGTFSTPVSVPAVAPGVYYLVAVADGTTPARKSIQVTPTFADGVVAPGATASLLTSQPNQLAAPAPATSPMGTGIRYFAGGLVLLALGFALVTIRGARRTPVSVRAGRRGDHGGA